MVVLHRVAPGPAPSSLHASYQLWAVDRAFWGHYTCDLDLAPLPHHTISSAVAAGKLCPKSRYPLTGANC
jgi:hypothetical protein